MNLPLIIIIIHAISVLLISLPFAFYWIVRNKKGIIFSFVTSGTICVIGFLGAIDLFLKINKVHYSFMFAPLFFFSIYQGLRFFYKKDTGREPVSTYATTWDLSDNRGLFAGDYIFTLLLLTLTIGSILITNLIID